ncbi:MAG: gliding motility-associated C-terminal domain-containing protein, partial [Ginsengibacter sp.]
KPAAAFQVFDTCSGKSPRIADLSTNAVGNVNQWTWILDGLVISNDKQPLLTNLSKGLHQLKLVVKSVYDCGSDTAINFFKINPPPAVNIIASDGCLNEPISFTGLQLDNTATITQWNWSFGDGDTSHQQNPVHTYSKAANMNVILTASENGCTSADIVKIIKVAFADVTAMNDTIALAGIPFKIGNSFISNSAGAPSFLWWPAIGLDNPDIMMPTASLQNDITYVVTASIVEGCTDKDTVNIKVFKGSAIYVPTGFTPNGDGLNDKLRPLYVGIKRLDYFKVYNRWGHLVFSTNNLKDAWDGRLNGTIQPAGTFVWMLKAENVIGKIYEIKGTTTIVR